jgi:hypothetical protein
MVSGATLLEVRDDARKVHEKGALGSDTRQWVVQGVRFLARTAVSRNDTQLASALVRLLNILMRRDSVFGSEYRKVRLELDFAMSDLRHAADAARNVTQDVCDWSGA